MDALEVFVRSQFASVGTIVLYPALFEAVQKTPHSVEDIPRVKAGLIASGWLRETVQRNPDTRKMEHRLERVGT